MQPDTKNYILYEPMHVTFSKRRNYADRIQITGYQGLQVGKGKKEAQKMIVPLATIMPMFYVSLYIPKMNHTIYFKKVNFTVNYISINLNFQIYKNF